jgi:membrane protein
MPPAAGVGEHGERATASGGGGQLSGATADGRAEADQGGWTDRPDERPGRQVVVFAGLIARRAIAQAWRDRILGLAAEAAFWGLLSLTPLLLVLAGALGYLESILGQPVADRLEALVLHTADEFLVSTAVDELLRPVLEDVLREGHGKIVSIGFLLALWTGSTAMSTYVNTISIAYAMRDVRSAVRSRLLAFGLYLGSLAVGVVVLPLLLTAPDWIARSSPPPAREWVETAVRFGYWPILMLLCTGVVVVLYWFAVPARGRWWRDLPGAVTAMLLWLGGSVLLRLYLSFAIDHSPTYGVLSAPIAILLFLYVMALAVLFGAELNSQVDQIRPTKRAHAARGKAVQLQLRRLQG